MEDILFLKKEKVLTNRTIYLGENPNGWICIEEYII